MNTAEFLLWEARSRDTIDVKRCYVDIAGDLVSGVLLSQIIYWHLPDDKGKSKLKVHHDGHDWLAKKREDWWNECRISPKQFDRAAEILEKRNLVISHLYRFDGSPTKHIRMNWDGFFQALESLQDNDFTKKSKSNFSSSSILPKSQNPTSGNSNLEIDEAGRSITETPTKITPKITSPLPPPAGGGVCEKETAAKQQEETEAVAVEVEIVSEEEIKKENHSLVERHKQELQARNLNPGENQLFAPACDNNAGLLKTNRRRRAKTPQISLEQQQAFLDAYLAEKPSNFVKHSKLLKGDLESIDKLVQEYGDRAFEMFVSAVIWIREREDGLWYKSTTSHALKSVFTNDKVPRYFDNHCHAMETDPRYRARVNGQAPSKDKGRVSPAVKERREQQDLDFMDMIMNAKI